MWLGALLSSLFVSLVNRFQCFPLEFLIALQSYAFFSIPAIFPFTFLSRDVHLLRIWKLIILFPQKLHTLSCWFQRVVSAVSTCCISSFNVLCLEFQRVVFAVSTCCVCGFNVLCLQEIKKGDSCGPPYALIFKWL